MIKNEDGSIDIYLGPKAPEGFEQNWIQTMPSKSWFGLIRLYGPTEAWFDKTWKPSDAVIIEQLTIKYIDSKELSYIIFRISKYNSLR